MGRFYSMIDNEVDCNNIFFKKDCEWKWFVNMNSERLHTKINDDEHKVCIKANENNRQSVYEREKACDAIEE